MKINGSGYVYSGKSSLDRYQTKPGEQDFPVTAGWQVTVLILNSFWFTNIRMCGLFAYIMQPPMDHGL